MRDRPGRLCTRSLSPRLRHLTSGGSIPAPAGDVLQECPGLGLRARTSARRRTRSRIPNNRRLPELRLRSSAREGTSRRSSRSMRYFRSPAAVTRSGSSGSLQWRRSTYEEQGALARDQLTEGTGATFSPGSQNQLARNRNPQITASSKRESPDAQPPSSARNIVQGCDSCVPKLVAGRRTDRRPTRVIFPSSVRRPVPGDLKAPSAYESYSSSLPTPPAPRCEGQPLVRAAANQPKQG